MGLDFIRSKRPSRRKAWSFQVERGGQDLLATLPARTQHSFRADMAGTLPDIGHTMTVQLTDTEKVIVRESNAVVGEVRRPDADLIAHLARHSGMAVATVAAKLEMSGAVDLVVE